MKILLTGKQGQLGFELSRALVPLGEIVAVDRGDCDLANTEAVRALVQAVRPDLIVNPAAYTAVDRAEAEPELAHAVNAVAPGLLGEEATRIGAWVIHYSTDYVFDGLKSGPYEEKDATYPLNVYGRTKRAGELALQQSCQQHCILRTSWVVGAHGSNFAKTMLRLATERDSLQLVADQYGAPTSAALLADVTAQLVGQARHKGVSHFPFGLYHLAAGGVTTWYAYACFVLEEALRAGRTLRIQPVDITPITTAQYPLPAKRPGNSQLNTSLFRSTFGLDLPHWQIGMRHILQQIFSP